MELNTALVSRVKKVVADNFDDQVEFLHKLVKTKSANHFTPEFSDPSEPIELEMAKLIAKKLKTYGARPKLMGASKERPNVVCTIGNVRLRKSLILNGHMDTTVPAGGYKVDPYTPYVRGKRMYGLGVLDMKASLSVFVYVVKLLRDLKVTLGGKLVLQFVVDEEPGACSSLGTAYLIRKGIKAKAAIVAEPGCQIGLGHRGGYRFKLTTYGEAVHTGVSAWQRQERGKSAIQEMFRAAKALDNWDLPYKSARAFPGKKPVFTFPTLIKGGSAINMVPDRCEAYGDVRLMPGNSHRQVRIWINERLRRLEGLKYDLDDLLYVPAVEIDEKEDVVQALKNSYEEVKSKNVLIEGIGPWNDTWMFITKDMPAVSQVILKGGGAHGNDEWVSLPSLKKLTATLALTVMSYLGVKEVGS